MTEKPKAGDTVKFNQEANAITGGLLEVGKEVTVYEVGVGANEGNIVVVFENGHLVIPLTAVDAVEATDGEETA